MNLKKTPELSWLVPAGMLIAILGALPGCGLKGDLYIPVEEPGVPPETVIETEVETGTGTRIETETESTEVEPEEQPATGPN